VPAQTTVLVGNHEYAVVLAAGLGSDKNRIARHYAMQPTRWGSVHIE
jgi:hypothetical protein